MFCRRLALIAFMLLFPFTSGGVAEAKPKLDKKKIQALADRWFAARPKTQFETWDRKVRLALLEDVKALGELPEGARKDAIDLMWKAVKKHALKPKESIETPYGKATWIQKGRGGKKSGLVLGLHGGGKGAGSAGESAGNWSVPKHLCIYPQGNLTWGDTWNTIFGERYLLTLIEIAKTRYEVDPDRVYTMGFSMGGTGSWFLAGRHPDLLAGAIPAHGVLMAQHVKKASPDEVGGVQHGFVPNVRNLDMYIYTGTVDKNCEPGTFLWADRAIKELKTEDPEGYSGIVFKMHEGLAHAFPPGEPGKGIKHITAKRRNTFPKTLHWEMAENPSPWKTAQDKLERRRKHWFYWLYCIDPRDMTTVHVTLSTTGSDNVIELDPGAGIAEDYVIYLNDEMIDVAKAVVVKSGGEEIYRGRPAPSWQALFESFDARVDRTMNFDRRIDLGRD